jgi:hypothetical protein
MIKNKDKEIYCSKEKTRTKRYIASQFEKNLVKHYRMQILNLFCQLIFRRTLALNEKLKVYPIKALIYLFISHRAVNSSSYSVRIFILKRAKKKVFSETILMIA